MAHLRQCACDCPDVLYLMRDFYYHFDNPRFSNSLKNKGFPIPSSSVVICFKFMSEM